MLKPLAIALAAALLAAPIAGAGQDRPDQVVIAHRGASGYLPEHTLAAYAAAYAQGADYLEPDLVMTRDGHFLCLHDLTLDATTNAAERFPDRAREDGMWYAADFTLEEIRTLEARERSTRRFPQGRSRFFVPTLEELIELTQGMNQSTGRNVGIYPELKDPAWHRAQGLPMEAALLEILRRYGYDAPDARVYIQSFEPESLKILRNELDCAAPIIQLVSNGQTDLITDEGLDEIAQYANGIGPDKRHVMRDPGLVQRAHARGLAVHPYTLRSDLLPGVYATPEDELRAFYDEFRVDGVFTDHPGDAVEYLRNRARAQSP